MLYNYGLALISFVTTEPSGHYYIRFNSCFHVLQVEIVCNEHVIHPFRTMKFIWISEWLNRVCVKDLLSCLWEFVNAQAPFIPELRKVHEIGNYSERMKYNVQTFTLVNMFRVEARRR